MPGNDNFTKVLLHFDGADAGTTITDDNRGGSAHTWTANGDAQLDTGIAPKFGSAACLFDGVGDYVTTPDSSDFTIGAGGFFTVDFWYNVSAGAAGNQRICGHTSSTAAAADSTWQIFRNASNLILFSVSDGVNFGGPVSTTVFSSAGWHHIAGVCAGTVLRLFIDGVQEGGDVAYAGTPFDCAGSLSVGRRGDNNAQYFAGSIDEFRFSVGVARWTEAFTPPAQPYDDALATMDHSHQVLRFKTPAMIAY